MRKKGFTFLEILFMVVIISVGLIAIMNWVPLLIQTKIKAERKTKAIFFAQQVMEDTKVKVLSNFISLDATCLSPGTPSLSDANFSGSYRVCDDPLPGLKVINVNIWHIENADEITAFDTKVVRRQ